MAKHAQFVPGFAELRGNISGAQKLQYPTDNKGAYEGPLGSKNYARNYRPSVIVSQRASDGAFHYSIRTKTANHLTAKSKTAMALLGGAGAMYAAIVGNKSSQLYNSLYAQYLKFQEFGEKRTFRAFMMDVLRRGLKQKLAVIVVAGPLPPVSIDNPWNTDKEMPNVKVAQQVLVKFWSELASDGITFEVAGQIGVAHGGVATEETFEEIVNSNHNVLNLTLDAETGGFQRVKLGSMFVVFADGENTYSAVGSRGVTKQAGTDSYTAVYTLLDTGADIWSD